MRLFKITFEDNAVYYCVAYTAHDAIFLARQEQSLVCQSTDVAKAERIASDVLVSGMSEED